MLQNINQDIDNSHFCDSMMCCSMYGCFCTLFYEKIHAETSVQLGSYILVLLKCLAGRRRFNDILYGFLLCKILKFQRENHTNLFLLQVLWKRKYQVNKSRCQTPYSWFNSVKRVSPCRCLDGHVQESYEMWMALGAQPSRFNFFNLPAHPCAVTYITEISLHVTLSKQSHLLTLDCTLFFK